MHVIRNTLFFLTIAAIAALAAEALPDFDEETYQELLINPKAQIETIYTSYAGILIARVTGLISSFSSCLIILVIARSSTKLSIAYHRIMLGMSVADTLASLAIFCSTWLMPKDMIYKQFEGEVLGNSVTCTVQGFMFFVGTMCTFAFNTALCVYYLCVIRYKFPEKKFRKWVEPILFFLSIGIPVSMAIYIASIDLFLPSPLDYSCSGATYPYWCTMDDQDDVCNYNDSVLLILRLILVGLYFLCSIIIFSTMFLVCWTVYNQERVIKKYMNAIHSHQVEDNDNKVKTAEELRRETKTIVVQAMGYLGAFMICQLFPLLNLLLVSRHTSSVYQMFHISLRPLQGLFNFMIFMGHKVYNIRRSNNNLTRWQAFGKVLYSSQEEPHLFLYNIDIVHENADGDDNGSIFDINFSDVKGSTSLPQNVSNSVQSQGLMSSGLTSFGSKSNIMDASASAGLSYGDDQKDDDKFNALNDDSLFGCHDKNDTESAMKSSIGPSNQSKGSVGLSWFSKPSDASRDLSYAVSSINS